MKLTFGQFVDICPQGYSDWTVGEFKDSEIAMYGTAYIMYSRLTEEQKAELKKIRECTPYCLLETVCT